MLIPPCYSAITFAHRCCAHCTASHIACSSSLVSCTCESEKLVRDGGLRNSDSDESSVSIGSSGGSTSGVQKELGMEVKVEEEKVVKERGRR